MADSSLFSNGTASAQIHTGAGSVAGVIVNSHSSGTIRFNDGLSGTTSAGVKATGTLTASGTFSDGDTILIGDGDTIVTYTMKTALTSSGTVAYEILIGGSAAISLDNIKSAINDSGTAGTTYGTGTAANPLVIATTNGATTQVVEANRVGTYANAFTTTETGSNSAWGAGTLASGAAASLLMANTFTLSAGSQTVLYPNSVSFDTGLYLTIGGTLDYTVIYNGS
jgi:hypothetical protein